MVVGGTVDTLFPLDEDVRIYRFSRREAPREDVLVLRRSRPVRRRQRRRRKAPDSTWVRSSAAEAVDPRLEAATAAGWLDT